MSAQNDRRTSSSSSRKDSTAVSVVFYLLVWSQSFETTFILRVSFLSKNTIPGKHKLLSPLLRNHAPSPTELSNNRNVLTILRSGFKCLILKLWFLFAFPACNVIIFRTYRKLLPLPRIYLSVVYMVLQGRHSLIWPLRFICWYFICPARSFPNNLYPKDIATPYNLPPDMSIREFDFVKFIVALQILVQT